MNIDLTRFCVPDVEDETGILFKASSMLRTPNKKPWGDLDILKGTIFEDPADAVRAAAIAGKTGLLRTLEQLIAARFRNKKSVLVGRFRLSYPPEEGELWAGFASFNIDALKAAIKHRPNATLTSPGASVLVFEFWDAPDEMWVALAGTPNHENGASPIALMARNEHLELLERKRFVA